MWKNLVELVVAPSLSGISPYPRLLNVINYFKIKENMKVLVPVDVYRQLRVYVESIKYEISGLGKVFVSGQTITITELKLFNQTVSGVETHLDKRALGRFYDELMQADENIGDWRLWWHSHADMKTFWSPTDHATIDDFDNESKEDNWFLSLVTNRPGDLLFRVDVFSPIRLIRDNLEWDIDFSDEAAVSRFEDEVRAKVKVHTPIEERRRKARKMKNRTQTDWDGVARKAAEAVNNSSFTGSDADNKYPLIGTPCTAETIKE